MAKNDDSAGTTGATWKYTAKRVLTEFSRDDGTDKAATLTYFLVLSIAPTLLALFSLATLLLSDIKDEIATVITDAVVNSGIGEQVGSDQSVEELVQGTLDSLMGSATGGTIALIIGIATALWSASAYVKAFSRVSNRIYEIPEGRGAVKMNGTMLAVTAAMVLGLLLLMVSLLLNRPLIDSVVGPIVDQVGAGGAFDFLTNSFLPIWAWLRWPVIAVILVLMISLLYWAAPNLKKPFRLISPGGVFAIIGIVLAAVALSIYMSTVAGYSSYGALGGVMAILFALWVMNIVIVMGAEVDAEYERSKELAAGQPAEESLTLPLRGEEGALKKEEKYEKVVDEGRDIRLQNLHHDRDSYTGAESRPGSRPDGGSGPAKD
ncbi:MAG: YihY/virulence factor BrkB family protein [Brachybacterium sp.]|nr:YihY/virulence factor BrkB family protein [Brachybacterium sp.]